MNNNMQAIKEKIKNLPLCPGVYIMKDRDENVIYVGKSKHLKNRVSQYFINSKNHSPKTIAMVSHVHDFDFYITDTEKEALVLECNLIKKYLPKYNILLKDDKQYPYIKITLNEDFPRIFMTRRHSRDGARYFGPYISSYAVRETLDVIKRIFKIRSCKKKLPQDIGKGRPCLYYHLNLCSAPCAGKISSEEYKESFERISEILEGKLDNITVYLTEKMKDASDKLEFEKAAGYRDRIADVKALAEKQKIVSSDENNRDIMGLYRDENASCIQIFFMRDGKTVGSEYFVFENEYSSDGELISGFIKQYYFNVTMIPKEILVPCEFEDIDEFADWLSDKTDRKVYIKNPKRGDKLSLVEMVSENAEQSMRKHILKKNREEMKQNDILAELKDILSLKKNPHRIECYDISNISGIQSVGACVVYKNARESKKDYRRFKIKTVEGANDYDSMREVIYRRIMHAYKEQDDISAGAITEEEARFLPLPDLILLDGGRGHVAAVKMLMETLGEDIPVYGLVKDDKHRTRGLTDEKNEFNIAHDGILFKFLTCMQDEVHRFAITAYRKNHEKAIVHSSLEDINGVGPVKRKKLMKFFGSTEAISKATEEELSIIVGAVTAKNIVNYYTEGNKNDK